MQDKDGPRKDSPTNPMPPRREQDEDFSSTPPIEPLDRPTPASSPLRESADSDVPPPPTGDIDVSTETKGRPEGE